MAHAARARLAGWLGEARATATRRRSTTSPTWSRSRWPTACRSRRSRSTTPGKSPGVNSKRELAALERHTSCSEAARLLDEGVSLADPARIDVRGELDCGRDVAIDVNCVFEGKRRSSATACASAPTACCATCGSARGTEVRAFSHLEDSEIGARCRLGPYARLRPGNEPRRRGAHRQLRRGEGEPHRQGLEGEPSHLHRRCRHRRAA